MKKVISTITTVQCGKVWQPGHQQLPGRIAPPPHRYVWTTCAHMIAQAKKAKQNNYYQFQQLPVLYGDSFLNQWKYSHKMHDNVRISFPKDEYKRRSSEVCTEERPKKQNIDWESILKISTRQQGGLIFNEKDRKAGCDMVGVEEENQVVTVEGEQYHIHDSAGFDQMTCYSELKDDFPKDEYKRRSSEVCTEEHPKKKNIDWESVLKISTRQQGGLIFNEKDRKAGGDKVGVEEENQVVTVAGEQYHIHDSVGFDQMTCYSELKDDQRRYRDYLVPMKYVKSPILGNWLTTRRHLYRQTKNGKPNSMTDGRTHVKAVGFNWVPNRSAWMDRYIESIAYNQECGNHLFPQRYDDRVSFFNQSTYSHKVHGNARNNFSDGKDNRNRNYEVSNEEGPKTKNIDWESIVKIPRRQSGLTFHDNERNVLSDDNAVEEERKIETVEKEQHRIHNPVDSDWMTRYSELKNYKQRYGDCQVPGKYIENPKLGYRVDRQRVQRKIGKLSSERVELLEAIGFDGDPNKNAWMNRYNELKEYKHHYGNCLVPQRYEKNPSLGNWVKTQRSFYRHKKMTGERIQLLEAIGFDWDPNRSAWMNRYNELIMYKQEFGNCLVPCRYDKNPELGQWVIQQRHHYWLLKERKQSNMTTERIQLLEQICFPWSAQTSRHTSNAQTSPHASSTQKRPRTVNHYSWLSRGIHLALHLIQNCIILLLWCGIFLVVLPCSN